VTNGAVYALLVTPSSARMLAMEKSMGMSWAVVQDQARPRTGRASGSSTVIRLSSRR